MEYPHKPSMGLFSSGEEYSIVYRRKQKPVEEPQVGMGLLCFMLGQNFLVFGSSQTCPRLINALCPGRSFHCLLEKPRIFLGVRSVYWLGNNLFFQKAHVFLGSKDKRSVFWRCLEQIYLVHGQPWDTSLWGRAQGTHLSDVTRILSSLDELKRSSFSLKYSSMHCSSKSWTFLSSSSVMKSSGGGGEKESWDRAGTQQHLVCGLTTALKKSRLGNVYQIQLRVPHRIQI